MPAPRLIPELGCRDIAASLRFYVEVLGFTVLYQRPEEGFAMLEFHGAQLMLDQLGLTRDWVTGDLAPPYGRGINFQIETPDAAMLHARVQAAGIPLFMTMEEKWYRRDATELGNRQFLVQDPDGYLLRFFQDLGQRACALG